MLGVNKCIFCFIQHNYKNPTRKFRNLEKNSLGRSLFLQSPCNKARKQGEIKKLSYLLYISCLIHKTKDKTNYHGSKKKTTRAKNTLSKFTI